MLPLPSILIMKILSKIISFILIRRLLHNGFDIIIRFEIKKIGLEKKKLAGKT